MKRKYLIAIGACALGLVLDQAVKTAVETYMYESSLPLIPGVLELHYAQNTGIAFGLFSNLPDAYRMPMFTLITVSAVAIIVHLLRQARLDALRLPIALGMILSGAFGNLIDRFRWTYVVDYVRLTYWPPDYHWPIFNLADVFITCGIGLLILDTLLSPDEEEVAKPAGAGAGQEAGAATPESGDRSSVAEAEGSAEARG